MTAPVTIQVFKVRTKKHPIAHGAGIKKAFGKDRLQVRMDSEKSGFRSIKRHP